MEMFGYRPTPDWDYIKTKHADLYRLAEQHGYIEFMNGDLLTFEDIVSSIDPWSWNNMPQAQVEIEIAFLLLANYNVDSKFKPLANEVKRKYKIY